MAISLEILFIEFLLGILLLILGICYLYIRWLNKKYRDEKTREISIADLIPVFLLNSIITLITFLFAMVIYAQICIDLGLINDGLYELNGYISFVPIKIPNNEKYPQPVKLFRILNKLNFNPVILVAFILGQSYAYFVNNVLLKYGFFDASHTHGLITLLINSILWFLLPFSLTISLFLYQLVYIIILRISRIEIQINKSEKNKTKEFN